jgi:uncharacterized protein RhaS with RHS repeats
MAIVKNLLTRNNQYNGVRLVIQGQQASDTHYYYTEAAGDRYYFNQVSSTASADMESATFRSFLSFTMSNFQSFTFSLIPMEAGESCMIETRVVGINKTGSKGYMMRSFGGFRHSGSTLQAIGGTLQYDTRTDFTSASASFTASATASIVLRVTGQTSETIDWDVHISYTKGFHSLSYAGTTGSNPSKPIYPKYPDEK